MVAVRRERHPRSGFDSKRLPPPLADPRKDIAGCSETLIATARPIYYFNAGCMPMRLIGGGGAGTGVSVGSVEQPHMRRIREQLVVLINPCRIRWAGVSDKVVEWFYGI